MIGMFKRNFSLFLSVHLDRVSLSWLYYGLDDWRTVVQFL